MLRSLFVPVYSEISSVQWRHDDYKSYASQSSTIHSHLLLKAVSIVITLCIFHAILWVAYIQT